MMVTPDFVSVWYLRPFVSNSMTWEWPRPTHNTSARAPAPKSRFMSQFYDTGAARLEKKCTPPSEAEKKSECAKNGKNASIEVSPEALGRVLRAHLMPAHPPTQRLGRFRVLILSFLRSRL